MLLLLMTLHVPKSWSQSMTKQDSICLCGPKKQIDSTLKILLDYPDLKQQAFLLTKLLDNERKLSELDKQAILKVLQLEGDWELKRVEKAIRKLRRKVIWTAIRFSIAGLAVGVGVGAVISQ